MIIGEPRNWLAHRWSGEWGMSENWVSAGPSGKKKKERAEIFLGPAEIAQHPSTRKRTAISRIGWKKVRKAKMVSAGYTPGERKKFLSANKSAIHYGGCVDLISRGRDRKYLDAGRDQKWAVVERWSETASDQRRCPPNDGVQQVIKQEPDEEVPSRWGAASHGVSSHGWPAACGSLAFKVTARRVYAEMLRGA